MRNSFRAVLLAPILVLLATAAQAQAYLGVGLGKSKTPDQPSTSCAVFGLPSDCTLSKKDTDSAVRIFGGVQAGPNFAFEVAYLDLGQGRVDITSPVAISSEFKVSGLDISGIGFLPFGANFGGMARVGLFSWTAKLSVSDATGTVSNNENGVSLAFGLGLTYEFGRRFSTRLEWERFVKVGNNHTIGTTDIDLVSLNGVVRF